MEKGWPAKGLLKPLWLAHGGRQALAKAAGVSEGHLSKVNAGKSNLGHDVATKIAAALGLSVLDLGAPAAEVDEAGLPALARLERLEGDLADVLLDQVKMARQVTDLRGRVRRLETQPALDRGADGQT